MTRKNIRASDVIFLHGYQVGRASFDSQIDSLILVPAEQPLNFQPLAIAYFRRTCNGLFDVRIQSVGGLRDRVCEG